MDLSTALENIDTLYEQIHSYGLFKEEDLLNFKKLRIEVETKFHNASSPVPLAILSKYVDHMQVFTEYILRKLRDCTASPPTEPLLNDIIQKTKGLHELRLALYLSQDTMILAKYLTFCERLNLLEEAKAYLKKNYPKNIKIWLFASDFFVKEQQNNKCAVDMLMTGLEINKGEELLYEAILINELQAAARSSRSIYRNKCLKRLTCMLNQLFTEDHSLKSHMNLLGNIHQYPFAATLEKIYIERLLSHFEDSANVWHHFAQLHRLDNDVEITMYNGVKDIVAPSTNFLPCVEKYKEGLQILPAAAKPKLWYFYLDFLLNLAQDSSGKHDRVLAYQRFLTDIREGYMYINPDTYLAWCKVLNVSDAVYLIHLGLEVYPKSTALWRARMYYEAGDENPALDAIFQEGREVCKRDSLPLWDYYITLHIFNTPSKIQSIYEDGIKEDPKVSNELKPRYLEWLFGSDGIAAARALYLRISDVPPYCKQLHTKMLELEKYQASCDLVFMDNINKLATKQFSNDLEIWYKYVQFKVSVFNSQYKGEERTEHQFELKEQLKDLCKTAKSSLSLNLYATLKLHCLEQFLRY